MASISGRDFMLVLQIITILIFGKVFSEDVDARSDKPCTDENFKKILLPCDINLQRSKAVYYMQTPWYVCFLFMFLDVCFYTVS